MKCHRPSERLFTAPKRNSLHQSMWLKTVMRSPMILWHMIQRCPVTPQSLTEIDRRRETDDMPITGVARNNVMTHVIARRS